jgi:hypothetical protein
MKVLSLLQDADRPLANEINARAMPFGRCSPTATSSRKSNEVAHEAIPCEFVHTRRGPLHRRVRRRRPKQKQDLTAVIALQGSPAARL